MEIYDITNHLLHLQIGEISELLLFATLECPKQVVQQLTFLKKDI